jgi:nucleoside-diphosphate-sugar epimerase
MKKAIVTGATGFIGSSFVEYLVRAGFEVFALGRKSIDTLPAARRHKLRNANYVKLDMEEILFLQDALSAQGLEAGDDCVFFNLAWGGASGLSDLNVAAQLRNVAWCVSALEVSARIGCSRFIQVGTMEEAFAEKYLSLNHSEQNLYNRHVIYAVAKIAAKKAMTLRAAQIGMDFVYVLHSHVMGPGDDKNSFLQVTLEKLMRGDALIFSTGEQYFDVISSHDCCLGYYLICDKGRAGREYWVGSGDPRRLREYVERMYKMYPSGAQMQFGALPYNDITVDKEVFSIADLVRDTGYAPTMTYEQSVAAVHEYLAKQ